MSISDFTATLPPVPRFYQSHIEDLQTINQGIRGIASALQGMQTMRDLGGPPDWVNSHTQSCLLAGLESLTSFASHSIEFLLEHGEVSDDESEPAMSEICFTVSDEQLASLDHIAERWGCSRDEAASRFVREEAQRRFRETLSREVQA